MSIGDNLNYIQSGELYHGENNQGQEDVLNRPLKDLVSIMEASNVLDASISTLSTINELELYNNTTIKTVIVTDVIRGGVFNYKLNTDINTLTGETFITDNVMVFSAIDGGYWVRNNQSFITAGFAGAKVEEIDNSTEVQSAVNASIYLGIPIINDLYKYRIDSITNIDKASFIKITPNNVPIYTDTAKNVLFVGDSLTELRNSDSYVLDVVDGLSAHYGGYKEPSYIPFSSYRTEHFDGVVLKSANMADMWGASDGNFGSLPFSYSPDGKGFYTTSGNGSDYISINFYDNYSFTKFRLFYLIQSDGGTFDIGAKYTAAENLVSVDTNGATALGVVEFDMSNELERNVRIKNINGNVACFGVEIINEDQKGGFKYDTWARNGIKLEDFENLQTVSEYENALQHDVAIINIGTNDAIASTDVTTYGNMLTSFIGKLKANNTDLKIILLEPVQPTYYYSTSTLYQEYSDKRRELAEANGWGVINTPSIIGGYGELAGLGMMEDSVHPNEKGKKRVAKAVLDYLCIDTLNNGVAYDKNKTYLTHTQEEEIYNVITVDTTPQVVANIGMYNSLELLYIELEAMVSAGSNGAYVKGNFDMGTFSSSVKGEVGYVRDFKETFNEPIGASSSYNLDISVQLSASNDCEILASTTGNLTGETLIIKIKSVSTKRKPNNSFFMVK